jgi:dolichyl-phosphate-mannose-protein mannosyltransferase
VERESAPPPPGRDTPSPRAPAWSVTDGILLAAIALVAGALRFFRLGEPDTLVFDEIYYAKDSCFYVHGVSDICDLTAEPSEVHPPLGKLLMAVGIRAFGFDAFGWRVAAALAGTATVILLYLLARTVLRSTLGAGIASGLLAIDFLHFVQSRIAMIDIFVSLFGVAAFLFVVKDRDRLTSEVTHGDREPLFARPWLALAGVAAGAAVASKWSGALVVAAVLALVAAWEVAARRRDGRGRVLTRTVREQGGPVMLWLAVVPAVVYVLTYVGRLGGDLLAAPWAEGSWFKAFFDHQRHMYGFHAGLEATHSYQSPPWSWPLLKRPVSYFFCSGNDCDPPVDEGVFREILASGSPFVWWLSLLALTFVAVAWFRKRSPHAPEGVILAGFAFAYLPWFVLARGRPAVFLFYLLPAVPFMVMALAYVATRVGRSWEARTAIGLFCAGAVAVFSFYFPLLGNVPIPRENWEQRIWIFDDCDKPPDNEDLPPEGWCWI